MMSKIVKTEFIIFLLLSQAIQAQTVVNMTASNAKLFLENTHNENFVIIDGRNRTMFESGHLQDAVNINAFSREANERLKNYLSREKMMIYCTNSKRSETIIAMLGSLGYKGEIILVTDGITGWKNNGFDLVPDVVHQASVPEEKTSQQLFAGLEPIVQVFGTAAYDIENNRYGYSFGRAHLGFQYQFNENWSAKMIVDRGRPTTIEGIAVTDSVGNRLYVDYTTNRGSYYTLWLKFASLKWQVNNNLSLVGGALLQNHYITQERFWGFRYVAQTFQDMYWHLPSSDLGFCVNYKLNDVFSLDAALTNGEGPRAKQDALGNVKYAAGLDILPGDNFQSRIYYHNRTTGVDSLATEQMFSVFAGYKLNEKFRIGGEFNYMENLNNVIGIDSYGFSVYSVYHIKKNTQFFVRYDQLLYEAPNNSHPKDTNGNTIIGGISCSPVKGINLSLNYQVWIPKTESNTPENNILLSMEYKF